jgi:putative sigma-54 modulation protein
MRRGLRLLNLCFTQRYCAITMGVVQLPYGRSSLRKVAAMNIIVRGRNGTRISAVQHDHVAEKLGKLQRFADEIRDLHVEVSTEHQRNAGEVCRVQATLQAGHGVIVRAEREAPDLYSAVDLVEDSLQRQLTRYKDRRWRRGHERPDAATMVSSEEQLLDAIESPIAEPKIIRTKNFRLKPMDSADAVEQLELLGHEFFVYRDIESQGVNVVYRRRDGNYGLIVTEG